MNLAETRSTTTWDAAQVVLLPPMVRESPGPYTVRRATFRDVTPMYSQDTASTDVRFSLSGAGDLLRDASVRIAIWPIESHRPTLALTQPRRIDERGPYGGRLISLAEACQLADQIALEAERRQQEARERDALYWNDLEDEE